MPYFSNSRHILFAGLLLILLSAWFTVGYHHPDEHFQILEFAKFKLGESPRADLPWEYGEQMRPGLQPFLAFASILMFRSIGIEDPFFQIFLLRLVVGLLMFVVYWKWCDALAPTLNDQGRILRLLLVFFWLMPYLTVRFSSENMSALAFFAALLLIYPKPEKASVLQILFAGLLFSSAFFFRYQIAFAGIGLAAWLLFVNKIPIKQWLILIMGLLFGLMIGVLADYWLYGDWVIAPYNYFVQNIVEDRAAGFGVSPWWYYFTEMPIYFVPPISLFLFWFIGVGGRQAQRHVLVWCLVPFVMVHSLVAHKETRFMFPMIFPMFYLAALGYDYYFRNRPWKKWALGLFRISLAVNILLLVLRACYPSNDLVMTIKFLRHYAKQNPGVTVFMEGGDGPQKDKLSMHFYQAPFVNIVVTDSLEQLENSAPFLPKTGDLIFVNTYKKQYSAKNFSADCVYKWFPDWILQFNPNNWQDRSRILSVYRITIPESSQQSD